MQQNKQLKQTKGSPSMRKQQTHGEQTSSRGMACIIEKLASIRAKEEGGCRTQSIGHILLQANRAMYVIDLLLGWHMCLED